jgi:hypothetical protein
MSAAFRLRKWALVLASDAVVALTIARDEQGNTGSHAAEPVR